MATKFECMLQTSGGCKEVYDNADEGILCNNVRREEIKDAQGNPARDERGDILFRKIPEPHFLCDACLNDSVERFLKTDELSKMYGCKIVCQMQQCLSSPYSEHSLALHLTEETYDKYIKLYEKVEADRLDAMQKLEIKIATRRAVLDRESADHIDKIRTTIFKDAIDIKNQAACKVRQDTLDAYLKPLSEEVRKFVCEKLAPTASSFGIKVYTKDKPPQVDPKSLYPKHWAPQLARLHEEPLPQGSPEWKVVETQMKETMPNAKISAITRIQNTNIWNLFEDSRRHLTDKLGKEPTILQLFHGTRANEPKIIYGDIYESGFHTGHAAQGMWGRGTYFAKNASYSDGYAFVSGNVKYFMLCKVMVGDSANIPADGALTRPPVKPNSPYRYDSTTGVTGGSQVYIVYDNGRAYPEYLIKYTV